MSFKILADTFSVARDSDHFIQLKTIKKPRVDDQICLAFEIVGDTKFARSIVQSIMEAVEEVYFSNPEAEAYERFENALKEINIIYKNLKQKRGARSMGKINAIIAVLKENELYLAQSNDAEAYLVRHNKLSLISEGLSGKSDDLFMNIASGEIAPEDKVLFSTSRLLRLATHAQLAQMCSDGVTEAMDSIRELVLADNELSIGVSCIHAKLPHKMPAKIGGKPLPYIDKALCKCREWLNTAMDTINKKTGFKKPKWSKNTILAAALTVALLLILSISFLMDSRRNEALREEYRLRIEAMNQDLHTANTKGYADDKETANAILDKVEREARDILASNYFRSEVLALLDKIKETRDSIDNITRITDAKPYADLSQKNSKVDALGIVGLDDNFFAYEYNTIYEIILGQVLEPKTIDSTEVVIKGTAMEDYGLLAFLTQSGRIIEYEDGQARSASTEDSGFKPAVDLAAYGRYLYLLSPSANQIYKYSKMRNDYSAASEYSLDGDLKDAISIAIDGNVYVLKKGGAIIKLFKGNSQPFEIQAMAADISGATQIYTAPELNSLYILDPANNRVVIVGKDVGGGGRYKSQMAFQNIGEIKGIYVDKSESKLYLLTKSAVYQVEI
jgi:hypothetical protein